tara:strand:+ start:1401 stop:1805 length:405 start_codon:yes stop_codon:yes gene_type:complete
MKQSLRNANEVVTRLRAAVIAKDVERIKKALTRIKDVNWREIKDEKLSDECAELCDRAQEIIGETPEKLHFKLEIIGTKANAEVWGNATQLANGVCSAMQKMPEVAKVIMEAAVYFTNPSEPEKENNSNLKKVE